MEVGFISFQSQSMGIFNQNYCLALVMSNPANYSPYNKTYKFLLFQNQAYHQRNKRNARPCVRTNLRYQKPYTSFINPEKEGRGSSPFGKPPTRSTQRCESAEPTVARSMLFTSRNLRESSPSIDKPRRVIHRNQSFEKVQNKRVQRQNLDLVKRLVGTSCEVIRNKKSANSFSKHLRYRQIRNKFDPEGNRKHALAMGNSDLLCPTLKDFNESGLGPKFRELDLSWVSPSRSSSPQNSIRKRQSYLSSS